MRVDRVSNAPSFMVASAVNMMLRDGVTDARSFLRISDSEMLEREKYEAHILMPSPDNQRQSYGSVLFYLDANDKPYEFFYPNEWWQVAGPPPFMPPAFP